MSEVIINIKVDGIDELSAKGERIDAAIKELERALADAGSNRLVLNVS